MSMGQCCAANTGVVRQVVCWQLASFRLQEVALQNNKGHHVPFVYSRNENLHAPSGNSRMRIALSSSAEQPNLAMRQFPLHDLRAAV
jgi:hypothetical protein